jgi:hypothetical protein
MDTSVATVLLPASSIVIRIFPVRKFEKSARQTETARRMVKQKIPLFSCVFLKISMSELTRTTLLEKGIKLTDIWRSKKLGLEMIKIADPGGFYPCHAKGHFD